jgi:hypothetical protein
MHVSCVPMAISYVFNISFINVMEMARYARYCSASVA